MVSRISNGNDCLPDSLATLDYPVHIHWAGCGDMLKKSLPAITELRRLGARITFTDRISVDSVRQQPPQDCDFFDISNADGRRGLHELLREHPLTHIYAANWPDLHLATALKYSDNCYGGIIVIPKPLDTNFELIETVAGDAFPELKEKIFLHDHYRNKAVVGHMFDAFSKLKHYGEVTEFQFFLTEFRTIEEERRLKALANGVIFDLMSHLFALVQIFFTNRPYIAATITGSDVKDVAIRINQVARARYINCRLPHGVETFAAISLTLIVSYEDSHGESSERPIHGLLVAGKGVKPTQSVEADLKGMRFKFAMTHRAANLSTGSVNPPLADLDYITPGGETGFYLPVVHGLTQRPSGAMPDQKPLTFSELMTFSEARENALLLKKSLLKGSALTYYRPQESTLNEVISDCVRAGYLSHECLLRDEPTDIGYSG